MNASSKAVSKSVKLPDGEIVTIATTPEPWWSQHNGTGFVDPHQLAPDARNPRRTMNPARMRELYQSIATRGVKQTLVVTPRHLAPWAKAEPGHEEEYFLVVGGHRRRKGALEGSVAAVPVRVSVYKNERDHRLDMSVLNEGQEELSDLERGYEVAYLQSLGCKVTEICAACGFEAAPQMYMRLNLTKLHPNIQKMLDPNLLRQERLPLTVGGELGGIKVPTPEELQEVMETFSDVVPVRDLPFGTDDPEELEDDDRRFALQYLLLAVIQKKSLGSVRAVQFIKDHKLKLEAAQASSVGGRKTTRYQPARRKEILASLTKGVQDSLVMDWSKDDWTKIFELSSREEVEDFHQRCLEAQKSFSNILTTLERIRDSKKPTHPDVIRMMSKQPKRAVAG